MYTYSPRISPPGPFLFVRIAASEASVPMNVHALLDTGADSSALPKDIIALLGLQQTNAGFVGGLAEARSLEPIYEALISIEEGYQENLEVYGLNLPFAILGRDLLNHYRITLDGPNLTLTISR